ncbi:MAG: hypothetical protein PHP98_06945, partial [Kiritimatiellae bacterium]|nr:hypothetical protein [Kiritimatiellia bacterium]
AFMNEREPASFVINNFTPEPKTFRVILRRLTGQGAPGFFIDPERMEIREGLFVGPQSQPVISDALPLLNESRAVSVAPGQAREIWLSINTQGIPPGVYEGDFYVVDTLGMAAFKKKLQVEVFPVCLPDKKPCEINYFPHWGSGHPSTIRRDRLETYVRDLSEHYCTMAWVQGWILPFPSFDSQGTVREMLDSRALPYFDDFMLLYKKYGIKPILYFGSKLVGFFAPECEETAAEWLKTFVAHMQGMGLGYDDFYFQLLDEPFPKHADILADAAAFVKKTDPNVKIFTTCGGATTLEVVKRVADNMDAWSPYGPYGNSLLYNEEAMKVMRKPGRKILFYNNKISNKHASPLEVVRKSAWAIRRYKTDGGGFWGYEGMYVPWKEKWFPNSGYNDFSDQYSWWVGDHGAVAYHDIRWRTGPVPSRRWEIWRDGIEDYTAIYLLEESIRKAKEKGVDTVSAKAILDEFDNKVMDDGNPDAIYDFRPRLAKALVDLNKHVDFGEMTPTARMEGKSVMIEWRANFPVQGTVYYQRENPFLSFSEDKPDAQKGRFDFDRQVFAAWVEVWQWKKTERASPTVQIKLDNLEPGVYTFCCSSADDFGTVRFDDNKGQNYRFAVNAVSGRGSRNGKDGRGAFFKNQFERLSAGFLRFFRRLF